MSAASEKSTGLRIVTVPVPLSGRPCEASASSLGEILALFKIGCLLKVTGNQVLAPLDGTITDIDSSQLSVKLKADNGLQLWIKVSEVSLQGHGAGCFTRVKVKDRVKAAEVLFQFNPAMLKLAGALPFARVIITNGQKIERFETTKARQCLAFEDTLFTLYV
ncbi:PTS glucose transporter subunit IIA [Salinimonas marina]|uniref:PTS system glucose-specific EIIA component n=1 Tax=Salinimonas marina TaxID=2785918 RepID=A0A7S9DV88_9ALTE|nr:PTS glucose transporter subunit IIA [Salinimonas marina]QPG04618.1 PTS glucose transporter subunit IIA [Salinimonas marina]